MKVIILPTWLKKRQLELKGKVEQSEMFMHCTRMEETLQEERVITAGDGQVEESRLS